MANRFWVGGTTGTWDGTAGTKWSATSGGTGGASVPTSADQVWFDVNSGLDGGGTVTISGTRNCLDFIVEDGQALTLAGVSTPILNVSGSWFAGDSFNNTLTGPVNFISTAAGNYIGVFSGPSTSVSFSGPVNFSGNSASVWDITGSYFNFQGAVTHTGGTVNVIFEGTQIDIQSYSTSGTTTRALNLNGSSLNFQYPTGNTTIWNIASSTNYTLTTLSVGGSNSTFNIWPNNGASAATITFNGGGLVYGNILFQADYWGASVPAGLTITGANTFAELGLYNGSYSSNGNSVITFPNSTTTYATLMADGATLRRTGTSGTFTLAKVNTSTPNLIDGTNVSISNCTASTANTLYVDANRNSTNGGGNTNITFGTIKYWIGGSATWNSTTNWSLTSGGGGGAPLPNLADYVIFESTGATITIVGTASCGGLESLNVNSITGNITSNLNIYTSANVPSSFFNSFNGTLNLYSIKDSINRANAIYSDISTLGPVTLQSTEPTIEPINNNAINAIYLPGLLSCKTVTYRGGNFINTALPALNIITESMLPEFFGASTYFTAPSTNVTLSGTGTVLDTSIATSINFLNVTLTNNTTADRIVNLSNVDCNSLTIGGNTSISNTTIIGGNLSGGGVYYASEINTITSTKTVAHTITFSGKFDITNWNVNGKPGNYVKLRGANGPYEIFAFSKSGGYVNSTTPITASYLDIQDCQLTTDATTWTTSQSFDRGNNTGWIITPPTIGNMMQMFF